MKWATVEIDSCGVRQRAIAPVIISASRSTDIPAFHAEWFMNRLRQGYVAWINPFNQNKVYVSFEKCGAIIFWSKNPKPLIPYLSELKERGIDFYFQFTLNDYEAEELEPNVPSVSERVDTFINLSEIIGKERVIWRFDPIIIGDNLNESRILLKIKNIGDRLKGYTDKLVFSFVDIEAYRKVTNAFNKIGRVFREPGIKEIEHIAKQLSNLSKVWNLELATCCEKIDLDKFNIKHNKCIDDELLSKICSKDNVKLRSFLSINQIQQSMVDLNTKILPKDPGQREECGCVISKDIGMYNTCKHLCVYCYANTSPSVVARNFEIMLPDSESIIFRDGSSKTNSAK